jgi:hypothetical protein
MCHGSDWFIAQPTAPDSFRHPWSAALYADTRQDAWQRLVNVLRHEEVCSGIYEERLVSDFLFVTIDIICCTSSWFNQTIDD